MPREPRKPKQELGHKPLAPSGSEDSGRGTLARRLRALRDIGPGSGSSGAWLRGAKDRVGSGSWNGLSATTRSRILAATIVVAAAAFVYFVLIPAAPCSFPGGDDCAPTDDAIGLVPADALGYAHLDLDPDHDQFEAASELASRTPLLTRLATGGLASAAGIEADFESQIAPWAGDEIAIALLPSGAAIGRVTMIAAEDRDGADEFASELFGPKQATTDADGTEISAGPRGAAWAVEDGFLLLGRETDLETMLGTPSDERLAGSEDAAVLDQLSDDRFAYAYLSAAGARAVLSVDGLRALDTFVNSRATDGVAASIGADGSGFGLRLVSDLDPERAEDSPGFFSALPRFAPALTADVGAGALAYLGLGDPASTADSLLARARESAPGLAVAFRDASKQIEKESGVDLGRELLPLLDSEAALSVQPVATAATDSAAPGVVADAATPYVSLLAAGIDTERVSRSLAELQEPVAEALAPREKGRVAVFEPIQVAGVQAQSLAVSSAVNVTYATYDDRLVIATDPLGIEQARSVDDALESAPAFEQVTAEMPEEVSILAYVDIVGLLSLGEQVGLAVDPTYTTFAPDLRSLTAAGLSVDGGDDQIRTDLRIAVGPRQEPQIDAPPLAGE